MQHKLDRWVEKYTAAVIRRRWLAILVCLAVAVAAGAGAKNLVFDTNYRVFFGKDNPQLLAFEAVQDIYAKNDNVLFVLRPKDGDAFSADMLAATETITQGGWKLPFATRVDSINNFQYSHAEGDDLIVEDLVRKAADLDDAGRAKVRDLTLKEPLLVHRLAATDGGAAGVSVTFTLPGKDVDEVHRTINAVRALADKVRAEHPDITLALTGMVVMNATFEEAGMNDMTTLIPLMYGVLIVAMVLFLRSFTGTLGTLLVIGLSAATAMGLAGWAGIRLTPPSAAAPTIILTLAIADSVHILVVMFSAMRHGMDKRAAIVESMRINFGPVFLTSLTTVIGFASLNASDAPPFHDLGNITAVGVTAAWVFSVLFLPAFMAVMPVRVRTRMRADGHHERTFMDRWADMVIRRRHALLWGTAAVVVFLGAMIPRIELDDQFVKYFSPSIPFRADTDFTEKHLTGIYQVEYSVGAGESGGINDPAYLANLDRFVTWLRAQPEVTHVNALTDIVKRLNRNMHADDPAYYRLPENRELAAQYLLLYEMSLPYGLDLNNQINVAKSATRVVVTLRSSSTSHLREFDARAEGWLRDNTPAAAHAEGTGTPVMFAFISQRNIQSMLVGTTIALVLISLSLIIALRNLRLGLLSMVPNLAPAIVTFGFWSLVVGEVGLASSVVTATSLGLIVDATVHFLSKYTRARRQHGADPENAVRYAFATVGTPLWVTTAIVVLGFAVLSLSDFTVNASLGLLTAFAVASALVIDFIMLPPLLLAVDRAGVRRAGDGEKEEKAPMPAFRSHATGAALLVAATAAVAAALLAPGPARAETPEQKGLAIAEEIDRRDTGFGDSQAELKMVLRNAHGESSERLLDQKVLEVPSREEGDRTLIVFRHPKDVEGTAMLTHTKILDPDDQWLFLPALKRVKRISSSNKSGPFVGSEFAYEDLVSFEVAKYGYKYLRDEPCGELTCFVVERTPKYENSGYTRQVTWTDTGEYRIVKVDFYDRKNELLKTLAFEGYRQYLGKFWRAHKLVMVNHQNGKSTELMVEGDYTFNNGFGDADFTKGRLKRVH
ncbi:MAG: outer membrane lipoprotein-sorting protein [Hyphomicrobiales bacterium]|nr:outer membrane lipoprotein-sorting protein [Hyphomicrobiales bacterium]MCP5372219.1 outer membrane lipoprotein-sorting protein [Hyphomicrobiales bacterium]